MADMLVTDQAIASRSAAVPAAQVAMVGAGGFGQFCLEAYGQTGDISVVAVADPRLAGTTPATHPDIEITADWRSILDDPSVEVIHLVTPPFLRGEIAIPALRAGKSVFCEKPLALSLDEADRMLKTARETGTIVGINYVLRHHTAFKLLLMLASSGCFGRLRTLTMQNFAQYLPDDHWMWDERKSGGILVEHGVHFFDAYGQISGAPRCVWGRGLRKEAIEATVQYAAGALGSYRHEFGFPESVERTLGIAFFDRGYVEIDGWIPERLHGKVIARIGEIERIIRSLQLRFSVKDEAGVVRFEVPFPDRSQAYQWAIVDGMRDLIASHRDRRHVMIVSAQDARDSLALALAARRAAETGATVQLSG
jgi:predicted dehydrogenase